MTSVDELEKLEKDMCNLPMVFTEMFKDEINSNEEHKLYNGVKRVLKKYSEDESSISAINEFTRVITGGASLEQILQVAKDEALNPTIASSITVDDTCSLED